MRPIEPNVVEITGSGSEWFVRVVENGNEYREQFSSEKHARNFADGQRIRLAIEDIDPSNTLDH